MTSPRSPRCWARNPTTSAWLCTGCGRSRADDGADRMAKINPGLLQKLQKKRGVGQAQLYKLVAKKVGDTGLPRNVAAVRLAAELGINVSKRAYASDEERAMLRGLATSVAKSARTANPVELPTGFTL